MRFLVFGDDKRQQCLAKLLKAEHTVLLPGEGAFDAIVLPCPSFDAAGQVRINGGIAALAPYLTEGISVFTCGTSPLMNAYPVRCVDLLADETAVMHNARLTAEAALMAVMEHTGDSLQGRCCLVIGSGRIGMYLSSLLQSAGAKVSVYARRTRSRAAAEGFGLKTLAPGTLNTPFPLVFNTVPAQALTCAELLQLRETCLWVELASAPGGLPQDRAFAFSVLPAGGLPGRYLPNAAARVLYGAICRAIADQK